MEVQGCTRLSSILSFTHVCLKCEPLTHKIKLVAPLHGCLPSLASSSSLDIWSQISVCCGSVSSNLKVGSLNPKKKQNKESKLWVSVYLFMNLVSKTEEIRTFGLSVTTQIKLLNFGICGTTFLKVIYLYIT